MPDRKLYAQRTGDEWWTPAPCATPIDAAGWFADEEQLDVGHEVEVIEAEEGDGIDGDVDEEHGVELVRTVRRGVFRVVVAHEDGGADADVEEVVRG